ncbi:MAG: DNA recombination protein RmuC [Campylobacterota bacterium]|nr:DNA recombination protein RmuC [Campylobacterota bacterium]
MDSILLIAGIIALIGVGAAIVVYLKYRSLQNSYALERQALEHQLQEQGSDLSVANEQHQDLHKRFDALSVEKTVLERDYAVLHTRFEEASRSANEKIKLLDEAKESLKSQFENLANQIFDKKSKSFDELQQKNLGLLLQPFREQITHFSKQTEERFVKESSDRAILQKEISLLKTLNERIGEDALNLTKALKGENKTQGNWGEIVLERILEQSGLREGSEYETQGSFKDSSGKTLRPDVIVHLPQEKDIIIDSKVSLVAYETFMNAEDPVEKERALKQHIASIQSHIKGLSEKRYEDLEGLKSLDFVLLFMPIEGAFLLALEQDGSFFKTAYEHNIMVVSPSTLLVTLRTIEHIWRTERQEQNAQEIVRQAENLLDKFAAFVEDMNKIGTHIERTQGAYDDAMNKLSSGKGNLVRRAENMQKLGLKPKKALPIASEDEEE